VAIYLNRFQKWSKDSDAEKLRKYKDPADVPYPSFLTMEQVARARSEWTMLKNKSGSAAYLAEEVLQWANESPNDPRLPEALHYAVRATRYGCGGANESSALSQRAFRLLHKRYPNSVWAKQTPYWY
jgi:hypothetical protein